MRFHLGGWECAPRHLLALILLAHTILGVIYSVAVPPWEAHDEIGHYYFAQYLATEGRLPPPGTRVIDHNDESHQPPLYYILVALATGWIDTSDDLHPVLNPYSALMGGDAGVNMAIHNPSAEGFPYRGTILALHVARLVSVGLSTLGLGATYGIGRRLFPTRPELALGATAFNALLPQYLFIGSVVTNDIMITTSASWFFLFLIRVLRGQPAQSELAQAADWLGMGLSLGAALLSKNNGLALLPVAIVGAGIALVQMIRVRGLHRRLLIGVSAAGVGLLALTGWWYRHNMLTYGGLFGQYQDKADIMIEFLGQPLMHLEHLPWERLPNMLRYGFLTFWASFGWGNVALVDGVYLAAGLFCVVGIAGMQYLLIRDRGRRLEVSLLGFAILSFIAALAYLNLERGSSYLRGRLCLPIITPVSLLLVIGWAGLHSSHRARWVTGSITAVMGVGALIVPFLVIIPTYARPPQLTARQIQDIPYPLDITFSEGDATESAIRLIGYELSQWRVRDGDTLPVTLYWQALRGMEENYTLAVKIIGDQGEIYGARHLFPGRGNFATSLWKEGDSFRETYQVPIVAPHTTRTLAHVSVSLYLRNNPERSRYRRSLLLARYAGGTPGGSVLFGRIKIAGTPLPITPTHKVSFRLGDSILLMGYDLSKTRYLSGTDVVLVLYWEAQDRVVGDYTVFIHLVDVDGRIVSQGDAPPKGGSYPTGLWEGGEAIVDNHLMHLPRELPSGEYKILAGFYSPDTLVRLPVWTSSGERLESDTIGISRIQVNHPDHQWFLPSIQRE